MFGRWSGRVLLALSLAFSAAWAAPAGQPMAGSKACATCHKREYLSQIHTPMGRAMERVADCDILQKHRLLSLRQGIYSYRIERKNAQSLYTVTDGKDTITMPIEYAFGLGKAGQTYIFEREGKLYESRVSFYEALNGLDLTMGARNREPEDLEEAAGRLMDRHSSGDCFGCHTTTSNSDGFRKPEELTAGVACERCHGSALAHVEGFRSGKPVLMKSLSKMSTEETSDFCGQCHRTWSQIAADGPRNINNVRFQPYRLTNSKCYDPSDKRIACTACHNVHEDLVTADAPYDRKCLACHATGTRVAAKSSARNCPVGTHACVSCHMPKLELPGAHYKFTDHRIRIVKAGAPYPD